MHDVGVSSGHLNQARQRGGKMYLGERWRISLLGESRRMSASNGRRRGNEKWRGTRQLATSGARHMSIIIVIGAEARNSVAAGRSEIRRHRDTGETVPVYQQILADR